MKTKEILILLASVFIIASCNQSTQSQKEETKNLNKSDIIDAWGNDDNGNAIFAIYDDSIYYPDPNNWYKYELHSDTILIFQEEDYIEKLIVLKVDSDSITLQNLNDEMTFTYERRK